MNHRSLSPSDPSSTRRVRARAVRNLTTPVALAVLAALVGACSPDAEFTRLDANPPPVTATDVEWASNPTSSGREVRVGLVRAKGPGPRPLLILVPGTDGLSTTYVDVAHDFAARHQLDVAFGCWFAGEARTDPLSPVIDCPNGPAFQGVQEDSLDALDALVEGAKKLAGNPAVPVALFGFSRGGGLVALRAVTGGTEVWINMAGLVEPDTPLGTVPGETEVVLQLDGPTAPMLMLHGQADTAVAPEQSHRLVAALRAVGTHVEEYFYPGQGHGLMMDPAVRQDVELRVANFVHAQLDPLLVHTPSTGTIDSNTSGPESTR